MSKPLVYFLTKIHFQCIRSDKYSHKRFCESRKRFGELHKRFGESRKRFGESRKRFGESPNVCVFAFDPFSCWGRL